MRSVAEVPPADVAKPFKPCIPGLEKQVAPTRHGITRGETIYFFDPSGNRNETFAGLGYLSAPDRPVTTWTEDKLWSGIFYHTGDAVPSFTDVYT